MPLFWERRKFTKKIGNYATPGLTIIGEIQIIHSFGLLQSVVLSGLLSSREADI